MQVTQLPIFIINLPEGVKRRAFMQEQMKEHNLKAEFFKATKGEDLSSEFLSKFKVQQGGKLLGRDLAKSELGCIFSHYFLLKQIVAEKLPMAVILEDDAKITPKSVTLINNLASVVGNPESANWDLLHFGYWSRVKSGAPFIGKKIYPLSIWQNKKLNFDGLSIYIGPLIDEAEGTHAYVVTLQGARNLLEAIERLPILPFDFFLYKNREHLSYFVTTPALMQQSGNKNIEQHINIERESERGKFDPYKSANKIDKTKLYIHKIFDKQGHPLYRLYLGLKYLKRSLIKTTKVISRPITRVYNKEI